MKLIRITTTTGVAVIDGIDARTAKAVARAFLKAARKGSMGCSSDAAVDVAVHGGRWHRVGYIGNHAA